MAKTAEDARKMLEAAKRTGKKLSIGYQGRHTLNPNICTRHVVEDLGNLLPRPMQFVDVLCLHECF